MNVVSSLSLSAYYSYDCFTVTGWLGPVSVYIYFIVGAIANKIFMGFLSAWIYKLERKEGDFRYDFMGLVWIVGTGTTVIYITI